VADGLEQCEPEQLLVALLTSYGDEGNWLRWGRPSCNIPFASSLSGFVGSTTTLPLSSSLFSATSAVSVSSQTVNATVSGSAIA